MDHDILALRRQYQNDNNTFPDRATLGTADGTIYDPDVPGNVFVRYVTSSGLSTKFSVRGPIEGSAVTLAPGKAVLVKRDNTGVRFVAAPDFTTATANNLNPLTPPVSAPQYTPQQSMLTLRVSPSAIPDLNVQVAGWLPITNDTIYEVSGAIDLSSYVPSAGEQRFATLFVKADFSGFEVYASTVYPTPGPPPTITAAQENINSAVAAGGAGSGQRAFWSVWLHDGIATISSSEIYDNGTDHRQALNTPQAAPVFTNLSFRHLIGTGSAPTYAAGTGAGTTPTISVSNATDSSGVLNVTTGVLPAGTNATIVTVTFASAYGAAPNVQITPHNALTALLSGATMCYITSTTTTFVVVSGATALAAASAYSWYYQAQQ